MSEPARPIDLIRRLRHDERDRIDQNAAEQKNKSQEKDVALNMKPKQAIGHGNNGRLTTGDFSLETWHMGSPDRMPDYNNHRYIKDKTSKRWVNQVP